jgi:hypothetical protein
MEELDFRIYMNSLEQKVIVPAIEKRLLGRIQPEPIRPTINDYSKLGRLLGTRFLYARPAVLKYYDVRKRSTGFMAVAEEQSRGIPSEWASLTVPVVDFSEVKRWHVEQTEPMLLHGWDEFCEQLKAEYLQTV